MSIALGVPSQGITVVSAAITPVSSAIMECGIFVGRGGQVADKGGGGVVGPAVGAVEE